MRFEIKMLEVKPYPGNCLIGMMTLAFGLLFCKMGIKLCLTGLVLELDEVSYVNCILSTQQHTGIAYSEPSRERTLKMRLY